MYAFFRGTVDSVEADKAVIDVNGIGYEINMPESELFTLEAGDIVKIYTYLAVREDDMRLFGFKSKGNLEFFKKLITVLSVNFLISFKGIFLLITVFIIFFFSLIKDNFNLLLLFS